MSIHRQREPWLLVSPIGPPLHLLERAPRDVGDAGETSPVLEPVLEFVDIQASSPDEPEEQARIHCAGARRHHHPLEWGEAHRGVNRVLAGDRAEGRTGAKVARDGAELRGWSSEEFRAASRRVRVTQSVESIATDSPPGGPLPRQRVDRGGIGELHMERGVEARDPGHVGHEALHRGDCRERRRVVERREVGRGVELPEDCGVDANGVTQFGSAVHDPVPDRHEWWAGLDERGQAGAVAGTQIGASHNPIAVIDHAQLQAARPRIDDEDVRAGLVVRVHGVRASESSWVSPAAMVYSSPANPMRTGFAAHGWRCTCKRPRSRSTERRWPR